MLAALPLREYLKERVRQVDAELDRLTPAETMPPEVIHRAMRYSLFAGGKRIRPVLCLEAGRAVAGEDVEGIHAVAASLELVHTYSLIHDDLPALDNDDLRRGRPTNHKVFGEAMAILAGDALLTLAFEVLGRTGDARLVQELASASGTVGGMIGGQVHDLEGENATPTAELLERIHRAKTGALLRASVRLGALHAGATAEQLDSLSRYGEHAGLAFQIVDDVLDIEQSSETLGKTAGKDAEQHKITFPAVYGLAASKRMAEEQRRLAHEALAEFGDRARRLRELADLIVERQN
ncbi:MAG: polyprenyl synthetase family protein [Bryobacteraceae bacterium]|nr:polyprenyl synthetase family protein [Solibacteraceae bacterium]MCO5352162.1 polyprenyl synthetase family protein [Bryobacteraceae bacterium]